ncbi:MAG: FMN-binding negative transcriptional regulator [Candidatus Nanopelagicales bacterium]|nr:FMN-binding negative transcriptional regulator [Candidatus Nanopelagicales bacterium]
MYVPQHFAMSDDHVRELLADVGAADLVTVHPTGLAATYLPFVFDPGAADHGALLTHVARNNPQCREPVLGEALVLIHGADHYVSPRWLPSRERTGTVVPTWNYLTVHAYGQLVVQDDPAWTEAAVRRLTEAHERGRPEQAAYSVDQVPADHLERMLRAIVGIEVRLTRVEAKAKMSQNRSPEDVRGIVAGLRSQPDDDAVLTATWMAQHSVPAAERRYALLDQLRVARGRSTRG